MKLSLRTVLPFTAIIFLVSGITAICRADDYSSGPNATVATFTPYRAPVARVAPPAALTRVATCNASLSNCSPLRPLVVVAPRVAR
jgi:hypothetical protein